MRKKNSDTAASSAERNVLRQSLRESRSSVSAANVERHSMAIAQLAFPLVEHAQRLAGYLAMGSEVDVGQLLQQCRSNDQSTYAPLLKQDGTLNFVPFNDMTSMSVNRFGIKEPNANESDYLQPEYLDAVLVPLVGFDSHCNRMGMGGGYYDRSFAQRRISTDKPLLVGVAFDLQEVESVHPDWWDVQLDYIVTQTRVIKRVTSS